VRYLALILLLLAGCATSQPLVRETDAELNREADTIIRLKEQLRTQQRAASLPGDTIIPAYDSLTLTWECLGMLPPDQFSTVYGSYDLRSWQTLTSFPSGLSNAWAFPSTEPYRFYRVSSSYGQVTNLVMDP